LSAVSWARLKASFFAISKALFETTSVSIRKDARTALETSEKIFVRKLKFLNIGSPSNDIDLEAALRALNRPAENGMRGCFALFSRN
jgi:hypothetical protein